MNKQEIDSINDVLSKYMDVSYNDDARNGGYYIGQVPYSFPNGLLYHGSYDWIMPVVEKIRTEIAKGIEGRDTLYALNYLLGTGYKFGSEEVLPRLAMTPENLAIRCVMYVKHVHKI